LVLFDPIHLTLKKPFLYLHGIRSLKTLTGLGLVQVFASKYGPNVAIFAGARAPSKASELEALQKQYPGKIFIVAHDAGDQESNKAAAKVVEDKFGYVDVVVANAGKILRVLAFERRILIWQPYRRRWKRKAP
jgi:NAD(P)-dependent dehydrogenase (short-subunit alcohol dehydrogenase family)